MGDSPGNILYGVDAKPPWGVTVLLACQHMILPVSLTVFAVLVARHIGAPLKQVENITSMSLVAAAVGVALQALKRGPIGSGYLAAHTQSAIYVPASMAAGTAGGPALIWGMTLVAGLFEVVLSRVMPRLKKVFPPQVSGVVVTMVGLSLVAMAVRKFLGLDANDHISELEEVAVGAVTMACLIGLSVWGKGRLRLYSILISLGMGYLAALLLGEVEDHALSEIADAPWLDLPSLSAQGWSFDWALLPPFLVAALAATVKAAGLVITSQSINEEGMKEADMDRVAKGVLADGLGTVAAGLLGTTGTNISPTSVSLTEATGASSRRIGFVTAGLLLVVTLLPKVIAAIAFLPKPIMGAVLVYAVCFITFSGFKLIMSAPQGPRLTYLVGISILAGLSVELVPLLYEQLPGWGRLAFKSPMTVSAVVAILLNLVFQIGSRDRDRA